MLTRQVITILGKQGSGKSSLAKREYLVNVKKPIIIYDLNREYTKSDIPQCQVIERVKNVKQFSAAFDYFQKCNPSFQWGLLFSPESAGKCFYDDFDCVCKKIWEGTKGISKSNENIFLMMDEADAVCSSDKIPNYFEMLFRYGRHKGIDILCVSRRPADLNRICTSSTNVFHIFRFIEPLDCKYIQTLDYKYNPDNLKPFIYSASNVKPVNGVNYYTIQAS